MTDLQCPAVMIFICTGERGGAAGREGDRVLRGSLPGMNVRDIWSDDAPAALQTAAICAELLDLPVRTDPQLGDSVATISDMVQDTADLGRGEVSLVITDQTLLTEALTSNCANLSPSFVAAHPLDPNSWAEVEVDSSGWRCRQWNAAALG